MKTSRVASSPPAMCCERQGSAEFVEAGRVVVAAHRAGAQTLSDTAWHWRAAQVFSDAQEAALVACYGERARADGCVLLIVKSDGTRSLLD